MSRPRPPLVVGFKSISYTRPRPHEAVRRSFKVPYSNWPYGMMPSWDVHMCTSTWKKGIVTGQVRCILGILYPVMYNQQLIVPIVFLDTPCFCCALIVCFYADHPQCQLQAI